MKKIIIILFTILCIASISACGGGNEYDSIQPISGSDEKIVSVPAHESSELMSSSYEDMDTTQFEEYVEYFISSFPPYVQSEQVEPYIMPPSESEILFFCLQNAYKDAVAQNQVIPEDDDENFLFSVESIQQCAKKLFGIDDFCYTDENYSPDIQMYWYYSAHGFAIVEFKIETVEIENDQITYTVPFYQVEDVDNVGNPILIAQYKYKICEDEYGYYLQFLESQII